jgi:hypothetical protein
LKNRIDNAKLIVEDNGKKDVQAELHKMGYEFEFIDESFLGDNSQEEQEE